MSETSAPRTRVRATDSKHRLFTASMELIGARGHHAVSVDEIAKAAGVSKGTVYYNFGSKSELIAELFTYGVSILFERLEKGTAAPDPYEGLELMVNDSLEFIAQYPSFSQLWISEQWQSDSEWAESLKSLRSEIITLVHQTLTRLAAQNIVAPIQPAVDLQTLATAIFGATLILGRDRVVYHPERSIQTCLQAVMAFTAPLQARS